MVRTRTLTENMVNFDVTAQVTFNMLISEAGLSTDGTGTGKMTSIDPEKYTVVVSLNTVTVTFHQNSGPIWLWVVGETGEEAYVELGKVGIIDKVKPTVAIPEDYDTAGMTAKVTFTPDERVICKELPTVGYIEENESIDFTFATNGIYTYTFVDVAGNETTVTVTLTKIDRDPPTVVFADSAGGAGQSWETYAEAKGGAVATLETVYVKAGEDCSCTFQGNKMELSKDTWTELKIDRLAGGFVLVLTDDLGNAATVPLSGVTLRDITAPKLFVSPQTISIPQNLTGEDLKAALMEGVTASDNMTPADEIVLTYNASGLRENAVGEYIVYFTATDEQGNSTTIERYVRVYGASGLLLSVKGADDADFRETGYMNTLILTSREVTLRVSNLRGDSAKGYEPFTITVKKGIKTAGQMKNNAEKAPEAKMSTDGLAMETSFNFEGSGYYTVYIVTQDRTTYLTYLYIEA